MTLPLIIQGGMGVAVSGWKLAKAVAMLRQMGVVSGTALTEILARRLQLGDPGGHLRRALAHFPIPAVADRILTKYFVPEPIPANLTYTAVTKPRIEPDLAWLELTVAANFVEVFLSKEGHDGWVGINYLEKIQLPTLPSLYGAMLANVDVILMGAGIPRTIPGALDRFANGDPAEMKLDIEDAGDMPDCMSTFEPAALWGGPARKLRRPQFLGIVASSILATTLARKSNGRVDGFVIEGKTAGGHNAPPRGTMQTDESGEPMYGPRDNPDLAKIRALGLPFWLAGSYGRPGDLARAQSLGAVGIQVGTAFAFCEESGLLPELKNRALELSRQGDARVFTDPVASPTGFPFKVVQMAGTLSDADRYEARERICDLGYLRHLYRKADGTIGYRCPAEQTEPFIRKGGSLEGAAGRKCICNGLLAAVGLGQLRPGADPEPPLLTAGNDVAHIADFLKPGHDTYTAADVIERLLDPTAGIPRPA